MKNKETKKPKVSEKTHSFKFTEDEIDTMSLALNNRIQYLKGILITSVNMSNERAAEIKEMLYKAQLLQAKTTYKGQDEDFKSEIRFI